MSKYNEKEEKPKRRFSEEQYEMLLRCSEKKDIMEWNEWRKKHREEDILLEGADLRAACLKGIFLDTGEHSRFTGEVHLERAKLHKACLEGAFLNCARAEGVALYHAHLEEARLSHADMRNADLSRAHLEHAIVLGADLKGANLSKADLTRVYLSDACLEGTNLEQVIVDGSTLIWECSIDRDTDFRGVGLDNMRIVPATKQLLEYNIRRMNWEEWYKEHPSLKWVVQPFWWMSDYGLSTGRIILAFFVLAAIFGAVYWLWPACVMVNGTVGDIRGFVHALYFSVVTMTTLGFGDIAANPDSWHGQVLLMVQVILGYVLLGALVTRFAVLFTAGEPAGKFTK